MGDRKNVWFALFVIFAINALNFFDRQILGAVGEPIRQEFQLSDKALGFLGTVFTLLYAAVGLPLGRLADRTTRTKILSIGVFVWSLLTTASGLARSYIQLTILRLGVGIGEATCAPAASSLIGDLFPARIRARAMSIFMLGLPIGIALSFMVCGQIAHLYGWRTALFIAGLPGVLCAIAILFVHEPERGATEQHNVGTMRREGSPYRLVLSIPTMRWIIASGALHNFNMYALGSFLAIFMMRVHHCDIRQAGLIVGIGYGLAGIPGLVLGGIGGDAALKRRANGRLLLAAVALAISAPFWFFALGRPAGETMVFLALISVGCGMMYTYYSTVYSTIQDVIEPSLRGTAMALYFCAMYAFGGALGPYVVGWMSEHFTARAAIHAGVSDLATKGALEPFRGEGLHAAMYVIPWINVALAVVLFLATRTVKADVARLRDWMQASAGEKKIDPEIAVAEAAS